MLEKEGWSDTARVTGYIDHFSTATNQVLPHLIKALNLGTKNPVIDFCCGHGNSIRLLKNGTRKITGVDFSKNMLERAKLQHPDVDFFCTDICAEDVDLPHFSHAICNFGICHMPDPVRALNTIRRAARPEARFGFSVWDYPENSPAYRLLYKAVATFSSGRNTAPEAPDFHQFANKDFCRSTLDDCRFSLEDHTQIECHWHLKSPDELFQIFYNGTVRGSALLRQLAEAELMALREFLQRQVEDDFAYGEFWRVPVSASAIIAVAV